MLKNVNCTISTERQVWNRRTKWEKTVVPLLLEAEVGEFIFVLLVADTVISTVA
jgi:hypothetical protein